MREEADGDDRPAGGRAGSPAAAEIVRLTLRRLTPRTLSFERLALRAPLELCSLPPSFLDYYRSERGATTD
jgi:hypothetical protein